MRPFPTVLTPKTPLLSLPHQVNPRQVNLKPIPGLLWWSRDQDPPSKARGVDLTPAWGVKFLHAVGN